MTSVVNALAPANALPVPIDPVWNKAPRLSARERTALAAVAAGAAIGIKDAGRNQPQYGHAAPLERLLLPLRTALNWMHPGPTVRGSAIITILLEMHSRGRSYWGWSADDWADLLCDGEQAYKRRHGQRAVCRQYVIALACILGDFDRMEGLGRFFQYRLAIKVFGRKDIDEATARLTEEMVAIGFKWRGLIGIPQALYTAMLIQRSSRLEDLTLETLRRVGTMRVKYARFAATLSRTLARMGAIPCGYDNQHSDGQRPDSEISLAGYRAADDVPAEWLEWCRRWRSTATRAPSTVDSTFFSLLKCGRWLAETHPGLTHPGAWTRAVAIEYVAAVCRMTIGQWSNPIGHHLDRRGVALAPAAKANHLRGIRDFFRDLQEWEWVTCRFDTRAVFRLPRAIASQIGPDPRVVADDIWAKLVWAGLNLSQDDIAFAADGASKRRMSIFYPLTMMRAIAITWLFGGLRSDEVARMRVGCIRWQSSDAARPEGSSASPCFLDVPVNKTSAAFTKPVDAALGHAVEAWQLDRRIHPKMADRKGGGAVDFLFVFRGRRVSVSYLNRTLIPLLCRKAGVPLEDARGRITSHRARATIASQLVNCKEPLTLLELQKWLGHATPDSTRHYTAVTPTKMARSLEQAGYFERNLRTIAVLVDSDAIRSGAAARNEPWRYYDLGHGLCTYDFFDQCPHRMACAKCNFYEPKDSARMQAVQAKGNLIRMLQELPLRDEERTAVEDGVKAMERLTEGLRDIATPDGRTPVQIQADAFDRDEV